MIIFPAIDIIDGQCVRLREGDYATAHIVADDPVEAALGFRAAGAEWIHMVDLDGAKAKKPCNSAIIFEIAQKTGLQVEVGGGIRDMDAVDEYLGGGVARVILGSAAVNDPDFVRAAVEKHGNRIAVGIDARDGRVAAEGWCDQSAVGYIELARKMEEIGVKTIIFTDISRDGTLSGPNIEQLTALNSAVSCDIIASGGVSNIHDIQSIRDHFLSGAICGKAIYSGGLDLAEAVRVSSESPNLSRFFTESELIPAIVQEAATGEVLMLAYMNEESLKLTMTSGFTWFFSRSRCELWNKGATSGHKQRVISMYYDCDEDTILVQVEQTGAACHTGNHSCFYQKII